MSRRWTRLILGLVLAGTVFYFTLISVEVSSGRASVGDGVAASVVGFFDVPDPAVVLVFGSGWLLLKRRRH